MKRAPRPKLSRRYLTVLLAAPAMLPPGVRAQVPLSSTYATRDGRIVSSVLGCASIDLSFTALPCGVPGSPLHVQIDGGGAALAAPGAASGQLTGVQGGGAGALPVAVAQSGVWTLALPNGSHVSLDGGGNVIGGVVQSGAWSVAVSNLPATQAVSGSVSVSNLPATQAVSAAALPLPAGAATSVNQAALNVDGGSQVHVMNLPATQAVTGVVTVGNLPALQPVTGSITVSNLPATQPVSAAALPLPVGAATSANQAALNADGGSQVHMMNLPATQAVTGAVTVANLPSTQAVSAAALPLPAGAATAANQAAVNADGGSQVHLVNALPAGANTIGTVLEANRSGAWTDASFTAGATASAPSGLGAVATRTGLHVWNVGTALACLNYTSVAAISGSGCAPGSVPIPSGSAYLEDQPGNVSPEAISLVCAGTSCPLTIKVR